MQEAVLEPAHFHPPRSQPDHKPLRRGVGLEREPQHVAFSGEVALVVGEGLAQPRTSCPLGPRRLDAELASPVLRWCRLRAHQDPGAGEMIERVGQQHVPAEVEVGGSNIEAGPAHERGGRMGDEPAERVGHRPVRPG